MSNIIDSLIYAEIKNNLNDSNYKNYDLLLKKLGISKNNLDDVLKNTTIKKTCCGGKVDPDIGTEYASDLYIIDENGNRKKHIVSVD